MIIFQSLDLALAYLFRHPDRFIFPIKAGAKFPPLIKNNLEDASNDPEQIREWHEKFKRKDGVGPNWGVALKKSGLCPIDVDINAAKGKNGQATIDALEIAYAPLPDTETVKTPSGGYHKYFKGEHTFALGKYGLGENVDIPNYLLIAGCTFDDGTSYTLENDNAPTADKPEWFAEVIANSKKERVKVAAEAVVELDTPYQVEWAIDYLKNDTAPSIEGKGGEQTTYKVAASLAENGISQAKAFDLMMEFYNVEFVCEPLWEADDLAKKIANAYQYANLAQRGGKTATAEFVDPDEDMEALVASVPTMGNPKRIAQQTDKREATTATKKERKKKAAEDPENAERKAAGRKQVIDEWVWVVGIERFINKEDTTVQWKRAAFESNYAYLSDKKGTFCDSLFSQPDGSIRKFWRLTYKPGKGQELGDDFNLYTPSPLVPAMGDLSWWDAHMEYLFPDQADRDLVLNWMAWLVQNLSKKPKHALLIQGSIQGTGKSFLSDVLARVLGQKNVFAVSQSDLHGQFNGWCSRVKLLAIEELRAVERTEVKNKLHNMITQERISINDKGIAVYEIDNCFGIMAMTNDDAAIQLDTSDRRYLVVRTDARPRSGDYYTALNKRLDVEADMAAVAYMLMNRDVGEYNGQGRAPDTLAKQEMVIHGLHDVDREMLDMRGVYPLNGTLVTTQDIIDMLPQRLSRSPRLASQIATVLKRDFEAVQLPNQVKISNGSKPRMWVLNGRLPMLEGLSNAKLAEMYETARKRGMSDNDPDDAAGEFEVG